MSESEVIVLLASLFFAYKFILNWYKPIFYHNALRKKRPSVIASVLCGFLYLIIAIISISLYPLPQNSIYDSKILGMMGGLL